MLKAFQLFFSMMSLLVLEYTAHADDKITIAIDGGIPPYVYPDSKEGIDVDIIRKAAELGGLSIDFLVSPYNRVERLLIDKKVQAAVSYTPNSEYGAVSMPIRYWHDGLIIRRGVDFSRENWGNLKWGTFPAVEASLGEEIRELLPYLKTAEIIDNTPQATRMMHAGRMDAYVGDLVAFKHYFEGLRSEEGGEDFEVIQIYKPVPYYLMFVKPANRDAFNRGLKTLKDSGQYDWIWAKHILFGIQSAQF
ncbi:substrate-binding periplasmic protein [Kordiimonas laminariae]|uniref:substrate-binding periplasmic protein n=1 Tax=Kordiimonas laminariae TaxID=2917717 RepID=UPI001FF5EA0F|nr:transporter substrate-binding domain-containing protein [Kordiimonas laminariae]MCK0071176.1 transporter substrate-binding domain-containing protein [Kordiimonas laminariae]